jgi:mannose-6-phosphate isomerase-like protein (cupin superfamily)
MARVTVATAFMLGLFAGMLVESCRRIPIRSTMVSSVTHVSDLPVGSVSHSPTIRKSVLASRFELAHITEVSIFSHQRAFKIVDLHHRPDIFFISQIAMSTLIAGDVASKNFDLDVSELFLVLGGTGVVQLGSTNHSVRVGSLVKAAPPTPHSIYNTGPYPLSLLTIASVP